MQDKHDDRARPVRRGTGAGGTDAGADGQDRQGEVPESRREDQEAVRQHAIAALNLTQQGEGSARRRQCDGEESANTAFVDGVRKFAMDVRELDIDLIDRINPFGEAYAILAKTMSEESLKQVPQRSPPSASV